MVRKMLAGLALAALAVAVPASAQSVDDILAKNYQAKGGLEKLKAVKSSRTSGTMTVGPGMEVPFTMEQKRPNSMRMDITFQGMTIVQAYDGKTGWMLNPMQGRKDPEPLPEDALKQVDLQADMDGPLVDYKAKGSTVALLGKEKVDGSDAYKIQVTLKSGDALTFYLDADSYLEVRIDGRMKIRGTDVDTVTIVGDYKEVGGLMIAHAMESSQKGSPQKQKMIIKQIELNVPIDDVRFKMPAAK
jgi:outer membrane lipoprotein-sorting protein